MPIYKQIKGNANAFPFFCVLFVERGVEGVEVARIKVILRDAQGIGEALIVHDLALTQIAQRVQHVGVIAQTEQVVVGYTRLLLCCNGKSASFCAAEQ